MPRGPRPGDTRPRRRGAAPAGAPSERGLPRSAREKLVRVIRGILISQFTLLAVAAAVVGVFENELSGIAAQTLPAVTANRDLREALGEAQAGLHGYLLTGEPAAVARYRQAVARFDVASARAADLTTGDPELSIATARQQRLAERWQTDYAEPMIAASASAPARSTANQAAADTAFDEFLSVNGALYTILRHRESDLVDRAEILLWVALGLAVVIIACTALGTLRPARRALRYIGPPLEDLHTTVRRWEQGDTSARADPAHGVVEIRAVSRALNRLIEAHEERIRNDAEQLRLAEAVRTIGLIVNDSYDVDAIVAGSSGPIVENFRADGAWVRVFGNEPTPEEDEPGSVYPDRVSPQWLISAVRALAERLWTEQRTYLLVKGKPGDPAYLEPDVARAIFEVPGVVGASSMLIVPMGGGRVGVGYLALRRTAEQPEWSALEVAALQRVGGDLGRAILHARVYERDRRLVTQLQELDTTKTDFVSMVSHELRTPLASIIGHLEIVLSGDAGAVDEETRPFLAAIDRNATRLTTLIEDLLLLSRIEQRAERGLQTSVDLTRTATAVVGMYAETAARHRIRIEYAPGAPCRVVGDPSELEHVITNLLGNAIKYSPTGTTVRLAIRRTEDEGGPSHVEISVQDEGVGISVADQEKIFERFYRVGGSQTRSVPGTGLGLAITRLVAERHGGSVSVYSELGAGSTFVVRLPAESELLVA